MRGSRTSSCAVSACPLQPRGIDIGDDAAGAVQTGDLQHRQPDGPRAVDQDGIARVDSGARQHVRRDGERLGQGRDLDGQVGRDRHAVGGRHGDVVAEAAVAMHAQDFEVAADVGPADAAWIAVPARDDGIDDHPVAGCQSFDAGADRDDMAGELVSDHPRIASEWVGAMEDVDVGAADARPLDPHQHLARTRAGPARSGV